MEALEQSRLTELEHKIERGLKTFVDVGEALMAIRDGGYYKQAGYATFELYCTNRWGISKPRAYQLIAGAETSTIVDVANEAQARELAPLKGDPERTRKVWNQVREEKGDAVTAADVREAVARELPERRKYKPPESEAPRPLKIELDEKHWKQLLSVAGRLECRPESAAVAVLEEGLESKMRKYIIGA